MNFNTFVTSGRYVSDIGAELNNPDIDRVSGFVYADSFYIANTPIEDVAMGFYNTIAGRSEIYTDDLSEAEQWLWDNFCKYEIED